VKLTAHYIKCLTEERMELCNRCPKHVHGTERIVTLF